MRKTKRRLLYKKEMKEAIDILLSLYPDSRSELDFTNHLELLVATILSAQCTDVRVNLVTPALFSVARTARDYAEMDPKELEGLIKTCGLYKSKAKNIQLTARILDEEYGGEVPATREELMQLPGVGRKTANVVLANAFGIPTFAVDTHVFRVSNRIGFADAKTPDETEQQLMRHLPEESWIGGHHALILHGRRVCKARAPLCETCPASSLCLFVKGKEPYRL